MSVMDWSKLMTTKRLRALTFENDDYDARSEFQRDIDRIIFSSSFRRLQDKTQVFPLPVNDFVHTRLTHSLEVASVGRSLGKLVGKYLIDQKKIDSEKFSSDDFGSVVAASCLAHDIGNPPFGHSGEKAIGSFFKNDKSQSITKGFTPEQLEDLRSFEGNAAGFRMLTNDHPSKVEGGLRLTFATLGAFSKYPKGSTEINYNDLGKAVPLRKSQSKFGFFQTESNLFEEVASECGLISLNSPSSQKSWCRHPLAFLMEAADTICYYIIDLEDGHKIKIISSEEVEDLLFPIIDKSPDTRCDKNDWRKIKHVDERVGALRSKAINTLAYEAFEKWKENYNGIMNGRFDSELPDIIHSHDLLNDIKEVSQEKLYNHINVVEVELAGFRILGGLLEMFLGAVQNPKKDFNKKFLKVLPKQFQLEVGETDTYKQAMKICDYLSRMTDSYAVDIYRKLSGIELPNY